MKGAGRSSLVNWLSVVGLALHLPLIVVLLRFGLVGVGVGLSITYVVGGVVSVLIARSVVRASLREMIRCVAPSTISVLAAFAVVFPLEHVLVRSDRLVEPVGLGSIFVECLIFGLLYLRCAATVVAAAVSSGPRFRRACRAQTDERGSPADVSGDRHGAESADDRDVSGAAGCRARWVESATSALVPALARRDDIDSVTVLRFHHGEAPTAYRRETPKVQVFYVRGQYRWRMTTRAYLDVRKARKLIAELKPDVVHGQEIGLNSDIAARCSRNCVVTVHGITYVETISIIGRACGTPLRAKLIHDVARRVLRRAKVVISISGYDARELSGMTREPG